MKLQEADRLHCETWNAIMFCGGPAVDSPTIAAAINGGFTSFSEYNDIPAQP
jgi:hypothetical protein